MKPGILSTLTLSLLAATSAHAWDDDDCDVPLSAWQSREAVAAVAEEYGWTLKRIKIDDGCYEVYGRDREGRRFEAKINPGTLEVLSVRVRHKHR